VDSRPAVRRRLPHAMITFSPGLVKRDAAALTGVAPRCSGEFELGPRA
jgi:hypothetical protein